MLNKLAVKINSVGDIFKRYYFYKQIISKDDLVFDIGANHGNRTYIFLKLGAKVIAIEPNPILVKKLAKKYGKKVIILQKAVTNNMEPIDLYINKSDVLSTTSKVWIDQVSKTDRFGNLINEFNEVVKVESVTIDLLCKKYGYPSFVKIDTEGTEYAIIKMIQTNKIHIISFEFALPETINDTLGTISHLKDIGYVGFKISFGESMEFMTSRKMSYEETVKLLNNLPEMSWGDLYAFNK